MFKAIQNKFDRMWIKKKLLLLVSLFGLIMISFYTYYMYEEEKAHITQSIDEKLLAGANSISYICGDEFHERIKDSTSISEAEHLENMKKLSALANRMGLKYLYSMVNDNGNVHFTSSSATEEEWAKKTYSPFYQEYTEASEIMKETFKTKKANFETYSDRWGNFRSAMVPFTTQSGKTYVIGADYTLNDLDSAYIKSFLTAIIAGLLIYIPFLIATFLIVNKISKPIHQLAEAAQKISDGNYAVAVSVNSLDETKLLADTLNKMVKNINTSMESLSSEKAGVEKKVEAAVKESVQGREYLENSVEAMLGAMEKFSKGDLTVKLEVTKDDIIGKMFKGFNRTVEDFNKMVMNVTEAVHETASAGNQISSSTEEMSAGSLEQANRTSEIAASVEDMTSTILSNTKGAETATETAHQAGEKARQGGRAVSDTIEGMNRIAEVVVVSASKVIELGKSSNQIGEIVQVIDDIADQTNLLALNAAIEAARAGEQGRGFAVVADEVRKLAEKTTKATKEISVMIKQIQNDTALAVESIEKGTREVESGKALAERAGEALEEIITGTDKVAEIIGKVASASERQASSSEEISRNIETITTVTQQTSTGIQQIARAAEDLGRLTMNLQGLVGKFQIDNTAGKYQGNSKNKLLVNR